MPPADGSGDGSSLGGAGGSETAAGAAASVAGPAQAGPGVKDLLLCFTTSLQRLVPPKGCRSPDEQAMQSISVCNPPSDTSTASCLQKHGCTNCPSSQLPQHRPALQDLCKPSASPSALQLRHRRILASAAPAPWAERGAQAQPGGGSFPSLLPSAFPQHEGNPS